MSEWSDFFVAAAGACAALAGLIIVAMSVSVELIISIPGMTSRAAAGIALLVMSTIACLAGLVPQPVAGFGIELVVFGGIAVFFAADSMVRVIRAPGASLAQKLVKTSVQLIPGLAFVVGGLALLAGHPEGAIGIAVGTLTAIAVSVLNAWVVLVEIKR